MPAPASRSPITRERAMSPSSQLPTALWRPSLPVATARVIVGVESPSFFHSMVPALAAIEGLVALVAAEHGEAALAAIVEREALHESFGVMIASPRSKASG